MLLEGWLGENKKRNLSLLTFIAFAAASGGRRRGQCQSGAIVFEHADRGRIRHVLPRAGHRGRHPESVQRHCNI